MNQEAHPLAKPLHLGTLRPMLARQHPRHGTVPRDAAECCHHCSLPSLHLATLQTELPPLLLALLSTAQRAGGCRHHCSPPLLRLATLQTEPSPLLLALVSTAQCTVGCRHQRFSPSLHLVTLQTEPPPLLLAFLSAAQRAEEGVAKIVTMTLDCVWPRFKHSHHHCFWCFVLQRKVQWDVAIIILLLEPSAFLARCTRASNHDMKTATSNIAPHFRYASHCVYSGSM